MVNPHSQERRNNPDARLEETASHRRFGLVEFLGFLVGHGNSIRSLFRTRYAFGLAAFLVFTAAMAREYDGVSLLHHPEELLAPFAASTLIASFIFGFVLIALHVVLNAVNECSTENIWHFYILFLTGYWMTAPLAWLYSVPVEVMTDEISAVKFNLTALSIVSIWRVLLFSRVVSCLTGLPYIVSLFTILVPCSIIALVALISRLIPVLSVMGGVRLTDTQRIMADFESVVLNVVTWGFLPVLIAWIASMNLIRQPASTFRASIDPTRSRSKASVGVWLIGLVALLGLSGGVWVFQPLWYRATNVDRLIQAGHFREAIQVMERSGPTDFPKTWDPPPKHPKRSYDSTPLASLAQELNARPTERWIAERLLDKSYEIVLQSFHGLGIYDDQPTVERLRMVESSELERLEFLVEQLITALPDGDAQRERLVELANRIRNATGIVSGQVPNGIERQNGQQ